MSFLRLSVFTGRKPRRGSVAEVWNSGVGPRHNADARAGRQVLQRQCQRAVKTRAGSQQQLLDKLWRHLAYHENPPGRGIPGNLKGFVRADAEALSLESLDDRLMRGHPRDPILVAPAARALRARRDQDDGTA